MTPLQKQALNEWLAAREAFAQAGGYTNPNTRSYKQAQQRVFNALLRCQQVGVTEWQRQAALHERAA